jgi:uncharacterized protein (TIGR02466 family)
MSNRAADAARWGRLLATNPHDRIAWHNLAAAEGDLGNAREAEAAARRALALGIESPETRLVLGRALQSQRRLDEAERAFEEAIGMRPTYVDAHRDLAQLVWMRTADASVALRGVDKALAAAPLVAGLHLVRSLLLEVSGDNEASLVAVDAGLAKVPDDGGLLRQAAHLRSEAGEGELALALAHRAASREGGADANVVEALLACGRPREADAILARLRAARPHDQYVIALQSTTWRILGDERYRTLCDYAAMVDAKRLDTPPGFATLQAFLAALAADLEGMHSYRTHPMQNSLRGGSQLPLEQAELGRPLVAALFRSIESAVSRYIARLGAGADPLRARNTRQYVFSGAWSVQLRSGGYHTDHVHPHGWISSACYIALPDAVGSGEGDPPDRAGWLRLGKPNIATRPALGPECYVRPEPGLLVLFPAYMWHGVEPFKGERPRLAVAFDVVPE